MTHHIHLISIRAILDKVALHCYHDKLVIQRVLVIRNYRTFDTNSIQ